MLRFYSSIALLVFSLTGCVDKSRDIASPLPDSGGTDTPADTDGESSSASFDRAALMVNLVDNIFIPKGSLHRLENTNSQNLMIVEIQIGDIISEDDIERFEDDYGRA